MKRIFILLLVVFSFSPVTKASDEPGVWVDLPFYEYPFNNSTDHPPDYFSMRQSMAISTSYYQTVHRLIGGDSENPDGRFWRYLLIGAYDFATMTVPVGAAWVHEEWHRSVLTRRKIGSFNEVNAFPWGSGIIAVDDVDDSDLIALKRDHPAEQVRLSSAGMEAQVYQNMHIEKTHFYNDARSRDLFLLWYNTFNVASYISTCASADADSETEDQLREEGSDLKRRDFTGLDCTAWVYDLFRPDEPYANRGTHPSGVGIKRYIKWSDLTGQEKDFLELQRTLSLVNFIDPFLFGFTSFKSGNVKWNFKMNHYLTSFGYTVDSNLFLDVNRSKFLVTFHSGMTRTKYFPGVTLSWIDAELTQWMHLTMSATAWMQPKDQRLDSDDGVALLDGSVEIAFGDRKFQYFVGYEIKNEGWLAGNVYLDDNWSAWTGVRIGLF